MVCLRWLWEHDANRGHLLCDGPGVTGERCGGQQDGCRPGAAPVLLSLPWTRVGRGANDLLPIILRDGIPTFAPSVSWQRSKIAFPSSIRVWSYAAFIPPAWRPLCAT